MRHERVCERPPAGRRGSSVIDLTTGRRHSGESEPSETKTRSGYFHNISTSRPPKADRDVKVSRRAIRFQELVYYSGHLGTSCPSVTWCACVLGVACRVCVGIWLLPILVGRLRVVFVFLFGGIPILFDR